MRAFVNNTLNRFRAKTADSPPSEPIALPIDLPRDWSVGDQVVFQLDDEALSFAISKNTFGQPVLCDFGKVFLPQKHATEEQRLHILRREIPLLLDRANLRNPRFGLCVSSAKSAVRTFRLPKMSDNELRDAVYYTGQKKTPFPLDDSHWNYRATSTHTGSEGSEQKILLLAVAKSHIDNIRSFFSEFGVEFSFIYQDIETLGEALKTLPDFSEDSCYGLMNVRPGRTDMSLYRGSRLEFLHRGTTGSRALTPPGGANVNHSEIFPKLLDRFAESLSNEVQNALDYYGAQSDVDNIQTIFIYGDMTFNDELIERFSSQFGVQFLRFPALNDQFITLDCDQPRELFPTTLPVITTAASRRRFTDLSPVEVIAAREKKTFQRVALQSVAAFALILGLVWHQTYSNLESAQKNRDTLIAQTAQFERSPAYAAYRILQQEVARQERILETLDGEPTERYLTLKELTALTPPQITVTYFEYYPGSTGQLSHLGGTISTSAEAPEVILAEYVSRLNSSPLLAEVTLVRHSKEIIDGTRKVTFSLNMASRI